MWSSGKSDFGGIVCAFKSFLERNEWEKPLRSAGNGADFVWFGVSTN